MSVVIQSVVPRQHIHVKITMAVQMRRRILIVPLVMSLNQEIAELDWAILCLDMRRRNRPGNRSRRRFWVRPWLLTRTLYGALYMCMGLNVYEGGGGTYVYELLMTLYFLFKINKFKFTFFKKN